jgi:hypothetical protein
MYVVADSSPSNGADESDVSSLLISTHLSDRPMSPDPHAWRSSDVDYYVHHPTQIWRTLYLGSVYTCRDLRYLVSNGFTHLVNFSGQPSPYPKGLFTTYDSDSIQHALDFVTRAMATGGKVLVYSSRGLSRGALFVILYLVHAGHICLYEAFLHVKARRPVIETAPLSRIFLVNRGILPRHMLPSLENEFPYVCRITPYMSFGESCTSSAAIRVAQCLCGVCVYSVRNSRKLDRDREKDEYVSCGWADVVPDVRRDTVMEEREAERQFLCRVCRYVVLRQPIKRRNSAVPESKVQEDAILMNMTLALDVHVLGCVDSKGVSPFPVWDLRAHHFYE